MLGGSITLNINIIQQWISIVVYSIYFIIFLIFLYFFSSNDYKFTRLLFRYCYTFLIFMKASFVFFFNLYVGLDLEKVEYPKANTYLIWEENAIRTFVRTVSTKRHSTEECIFVRPINFQVQDLPKPSLEDTKITLEEDLSENEDVLNENEKLNNV